MKTISRGASSQRKKPSVDRVLPGCYRGFNNFQLLTLYIIFTLYISSYRVKWRLIPSEREGLIIWEKQVRSSQTLIRKHRIKLEIAELNFELKILYFPEFNFSRRWRFTIELDYSPD